MCHNIICSLSHPLLNYIVKYSIKIIKENISEQNVRCSLNANFYKISLNRLNKYTVSQYTIFIHEKENQ